MMSAMCCYSTYSSQYIKFGKVSGETVQPVLTLNSLSTRGHAATFLLAVLVWNKQLNLAESSDRNQVNMLAKSVCVSCVCKKVESKYRLIHRILN